MKTAIVFALLAAPLAVADELKLPIAGGPYQPTMESLRHYRCPDWFRDAKFGMWAHWGPQAVPEMGDWYAQRMYKEGDAKYKDHLARWGHPGEHGYKDIIPLWKAEKWDPDRLMALYKKAGAKYFVSMGTHHDNFYLWNSKLHKWNAVNMGPKRDVVGDWQAAARKHGLYFGVSEHLGASFTWFQWSHKADKDGPKAGVPYDGADPRWQDLYHFPAEPGDDKWYSTNPRWHQQWFDRIRELVDNYKPDLLYTDGGVAFGPEHVVGLSLIAHLYNSNPQVVYNCKQASEGRWVQDLERGVMAGVNPHPWQTDTSIGDWYYNKNWKFRPVSWTIHMLVDIVSKNGNLLLNIVQRPDGSLDPEVEQQLEELARWIAIHGEAIYETRPWLTYGEGAVKTKGGHFKEDFNYTARDIRFTTKGATLYATALGWPEDGRLQVRSLASTAGRVASVSLLGSGEKLSWRQTEEGLVVTLPATRISDYTATLKIEGTDLKPVPVPDEAVIVQPDGKGNIKLDANDAELHGEQIKVEQKGVHANIGFWDRNDEWASWKMRIPAPGRYNISINAATTADASAFTLAIGGRKLDGRVTKTGEWDAFRNFKLGLVEIDQTGVVEVTVRPEPGAWHAINVRDVRCEIAN